VVKPKRSRTRNSSGDEIATANVNFLYDDIVHAVQNTVDSSIFVGFQPQFGLDSAESDVTFDLVSRPLNFSMSEYRPSRSMGGDSRQHVQTCRTIT